MPELVWYRDHKIELFQHPDKLYSYITSFEYDYSDESEPIFKTKQEAISDAKAEIDYGIYQQELQDAQENT